MERAGKATGNVVHCKRGKSRVRQMTIVFSLHLIGRADSISVLIGQNTFHKLLFPNYIAQEAQNQNKHNYFVQSIENRSMSLLCHRKIRKVFYSPFSRCLIRLRNKIQLQMFFLPQYLILAVPTASYHLINHSMLNYT